MIADAFIKRPRLASVISIVIVLAGLLALIGMPVEQYPNIAPPSVSVTAVYPGASSDVVESTVAQQIESAINGVENMLYMSSTSNDNGSYNLTVTFNTGTDPDIATVNVQNRLKKVESNLPDEVVQQGIEVRSRMASMLQIFAISSDKKPRSLIKAVYELRAAGNSGYMPDLSGCAFCRKEKGEGLYLDVMNGCITCSECMMKQAAHVTRPPSDESEERNILLPINGSVLAAMRYAIYAPGERMLSFKLNGDDENAMFSKAAEEYLLHHLERGFSSLEFYKSLLSMKI